MCCYKIPGTQTTFLTHFCLNSLCSQSLTWPSDRWATQRHMGSFPRILLNVKAAWQCGARSVLEGSGIHSFVLFNPLSGLWGASDDLSQGCSQGQPLSREYPWGGSWSSLELVLLCNFMRTSTIPDAFVSGGESSRDSILNALIYIQQVSH